jgi:signal transduction histidine kinase
MLSEKKSISVKIDETKLKERNKELSVLLEMSNFLSSPLDLEALLRGALSKVLAFFELEAGRVYLLDEEKQSLGLAAYQGMAPEGLEKVHLDEGFSGESARTKSFLAQYVSELQDKKRSALLLSKGFKIIICVPLITMDRVVGVMNLATGKMIRLDQNKIDLLTTIGNQVAIASNNARLFAELKHRFEALKEKEETIKFFAYSISHDLKSPAVAIYGLTKRLQEKCGGALDEKGRAHCDQILKSAEHMVSLVEKINAYIVVKELPMDLERIRIREITASVRDEYAALLKERQIKWVEIGDLPEIVADRLSVTRLFRNLVDNALKYGGPEMGKIKIGYEDKGDFHLFTFSDDGVGIPASSKDKLFKLFQRQETSRGTPGSGIGLAIVKEIVERHGGRIWLDWEAKRGTRFYFSIAKDLDSNK